MLTAIVLLPALSSSSFAATGVAIEFDGTDDSVDFGNQATIQDSNGDWVVAGWVWLDSLSASVWLFGDRDSVAGTGPGIKAWIATSGEVTFCVKESSNVQQRCVTTSSTTPYTTDTWQKWAIRYDPSLSSGVMAMDGDGNLDAATDAFVDDSGAQNDGLHIGASVTNTDDMDGKIAYVHIWCCDKTSSAATIASALDDPGSDTGSLISAYWFCSGDETADASGNGNTATLGGNAAHSSAGPTVTNDPCAGAAANAEMVASGMTFSGMVLSGTNT